MTSQRQRLAYARVCVEVDKDSSFPSSIEIMDHDGTTFTQPIEYEWIPTICDGCKQYGHKSSQCTKIARKEWRPVNKAIGREVPPSSTDMKEAENNQPPEDKAEAGDDKLIHCPSRIESSPSKAIVIHNQFSSLGVNDHEDALIISPLATEASSGVMEVDEECSPNDKGKELLNANSSPFPEAKLLEYDKPSSEAPLSNTQKKKKGKIQHANSAKTKAHKAKSHSPPLSIK